MSAAHCQPATQSAAALHRALHAPLPSPMFTQMPLAQSLLRSHGFPTSDGRAATQSPDWHVAPLTQGVDEAQQGCESPPHVVGASPAASLPGVESASMSASGLLLGSRGLSDPPLHATRAIETANKDQCTHVRRDVRIILRS